MTSPSPNSLPSRGPEPLPDSASAARNPAAPGPQPPPPASPAAPATHALPAIGEPDSARTVLEALAQDRGTRLLPEEDYQEMRTAILQELAEGPRLKGSMLVTFTAVGLLLLAFLGIGVAMTFRHGPAESLLIVAATVSLGFWAWLLRQYIVSVHDQARMSIRARLAELEELRVHRLISQEEFETIYAAIHMTRGAPPA